jgi:hypothetical protein
VPRKETIVKSKIGFHIDIQIHPGQAEKMIRAETRIVKVITSMGFLRDLHHALGDKTILIARDWKVSDDFTRFGGPTDPVGAARRWLDAMRPSIVQAPFAYWEGFNEMNNWAMMRQYGEFEAERQRLMAAEGFKCCIGNFSTGTPSISNAPGDGREDLWPQFYPALAAAHQFKNILGLHEYGGIWLDLFYGPNQAAAVQTGKRVPFPQSRDEGWLFGRYRKVWRRHIEPNGWTNLRIALTEFGLDKAGDSVTTPLAGYVTQAWRTCGSAWSKLDRRSDSEQYYFEQLQWADRQMQQDPYLVGATIFTWGSFADGWHDFDIEGPVAEKLVSYIQSTRDDPVIPGPGDPVPSMYITPVASSGLRVRKGPGTQHEFIVLTHAGDKLGTLEPESVVLAKLGKQNEWLHIVTSADVEGYVAAWLVEKFGMPPIEPPPTGEKVIVTPIVALGADLYAGPGTQYPKLDRLYMGDQIELLEPTAANIANIGKPGIWLKVRTPRGMNGYLESRVVQRAYTGEHRDEPPKPNEPLILHTTADTGLNVRSGPGVQFQPIASVFRPDRLEVVGDANQARANLGKSGQWIQIRTPKGVVGYAGAAFLEVMPPYYIWPVGHSLVGLHGPADPGEWAWDEGAYETVRTAKIQAVKLLAGDSITGNVVTRLRQREGVKFVMARLFVKITQPMTAQQFVNQCIDAATRLYDSGVRYFEVHNEPNLHTKDSPEGMWINWQNGSDFGRFFLEVVTIMKRSLPAAQFGFPGVSPGVDVPNVRVSSDVFLQQADSALRRADFVCMHTYWGGDGSNFMNSVAQVRKFCDTYPSQLVFVTEFSNSSPNIGKDVKAREYAQFYTEAHKLNPNLGGLFSYVLSSSGGYQAETWKGSQIPVTVGGRPQIS